MAKKQIVMPGIKTFKISELAAAEYNPRIISKEALAGLTNSIQRFGCVEPIVVNIKGGANTIIGGHQRFKALKKLKAKEVICVTVSCTKKEERLLNLTLNNPEIQGQFFEKINDYLQALRSELGNDTGFVDLRIQQLMEEIQQEGDKYQFRPGQSNPKVSGSEKTFWLTKAQLKKFEKYENFILDFSGGRDSTLALAWAVTYFADRKIYAVYSDVGVEFPGMGAHVRNVCDFFKVECIILKPESEWWSWLAEQGKWPSLIFRPCQIEFIFKMTAKFRKQFEPTNTLLFDGSRGKQAVRGSKKNKTSEVGSCPGYPAYHPCFELTDKAAAGLLKKFKPPLWEGYD